MKIKKMRLIRIIKKKKEKDRSKKEKKEINTKYSKKRTMMIQIKRNSKKNSMIF